MCCVHPQAFIDECNDAAEEAHQASEEEQEAAEVSRGEGKQTAHPVVHIPYTTHVSVFRMTVMMVTVMRRRRLRRCVLVYACNPAFLARCA